MDYDWSEWEWAPQYNCFARSREDEQGNVFWEHAASLNEPRYAPRPEPEPAPIDVDERLQQNLSGTSSIGNYTYHDPSDIIGAERDFAGLSISPRSQPRRYSNISRSLAGSSIAGPSRQAEVDDDELELAILGDEDENLGEPPDDPDIESPLELVRSKTQENKHHMNAAGQKIVEKKLDDEYSIHQSKSFRKGRVFKTVWSEPYGNAGGTEKTAFTRLDPEQNSSKITDSQLGEKACHEIRRFVIVKARKGHCLCVPIMTYGRQGTSKRGFKSEDHTIIYTGSKPPKRLDGEKGLRKEPIRMVPTSRRHKLFPTSRLNYAKVYTVEHNLKVCFIGAIDKNDEAIFFRDFKRRLDED